MKDAIPGSNGSAFTVRGDDFMRSTTKLTTWPSSVSV